MHEALVVEATTSDVPPAQNVRLQDLRRQEAGGYAVMAAAAAFGQATQSNGLKRAVKLAEALIICFVFITPVVALWSYVY